MITLPKPPAWMADALCAQIGNDDLWFPAKGGSTRSARSVCRTCPVIGECLNAAMTAERNPDGIWGNTTYRQREAMRRATA